MQSSIISLYCFHLAGSVLGMSGTAVIEGTCVYVNV